MTLVSFDIANRACLQGPAARAARFDHRPCARSCWRKKIRGRGSASAAIAKASSSQQQPGAGAPTPASAAAVARPSVLMPGEREVALRMIAVLSSTADRQQAVLGAVPRLAPSARVSAAPLWEQADALLPASVP
jgi:hypothetical protein